MKLTVDDFPKVLPCAARLTKPFPWQRRLVNEIANSPNRRWPAVLKPANGDRQDIGH